MNYSKKAKKNWLNYNFKYEEGSPEELFKFKNLKHVKILIIKLKYFIDEKFINKIPNLKYILTATTGLVHIEDKLKKNKKIEIFSLKEEREFLNSITSTAELTWGLIISLIRKYL